MLLTVKKYLKPNNLFTNLLVPAAMLALYCGSFAFIAARLLGRGVNPVFANRAFQYSLILCAVIILLIFFARRLYPHEAVLQTRPLTRLSARDLLLLLLPLTPVAQYVINNKAILSPLDALIVVAFFAFLASITIYLVPMLLGRFSDTRLLMAVGLAFAFTITAMASLTHYFSWLNKGSIRIQLLLFAIIFGLAWVFSLPKNRNLFYLLVTLIFIANSGLQLAAKSSANPAPAPAAANTAARAEFSGKTPVTTPNIYLLVYDSYVPNETMLAYGLDNSAQENFLSDQGFVLYPRTYSTGSTTLESMGGVLNVPYGKDQSDLQTVSGDGSVQNLLKSMGYQTYGIFPYDYMFRGIKSSYDISFPEGKKSYAHLISATLLGEFRFDIGFDDISHETYVEKKDNILAGVAARPIFVYSHTNIPNHSQNSGQCLSNEASLYQERLDRANREMRQDIQILTNADPQAIIIVAGDHGPYLTKNCYVLSNVYPKSAITRLDIQDRFGSFLAIRWPSADYVKYADITILQDVFPSVFAYLYKDPSIASLKTAPSIRSNSTSGVTVTNGIIGGGVNDGEPLYLSGK